MAAYWKIKEIVGTEHREEPVRDRAASAWKEMLSGSEKKKSIPFLCSLAQHTAAVATRSDLVKERKKVYTHIQPKQKNKTKTRMCLVATHNAL